MSPRLFRSAPPRAQSTVQFPPGFAAGTHGGNTTPDERQWALTAYVGQFLLWVLPPLYIYLTKKRRSRFALHHSRQALNLALTTGIVFAAAIGLSQLAPAFLWVAMGWVVLSMVVVVWSATKVNQGSWHRIPKIIALPFLR
ncbi:MAG: DUF4870 domain-containing protein [Streptosporangiaceae bacterium]